MHLFLPATRVTFPVFVFFYSYYVWLYVNEPALSFHEWNVCGYVTTVYHLPFLPSRQPAGCLRGRTRAPCTRSPPPLPPLSTAGGMSAGTYVRAVYPFTAGEATDLSLSAGDVIRVGPQPMAGADTSAWLHGQNILSMASGYFPRECSGD